MKKDMRSKQKYPRSSGVLLPLPMLHGPFGIGVMGTEAMEFIDFLSRSGFSAWQMLPIEHTGEAFSPFYCVSAFAGEPNLIDPRILLEMGLVTREELRERAEGTKEDFVDYELITVKQQKLLKSAFSRLKDKPYSDFKPFWLDNYALYMALKKHFEDKPWYQWPDIDLRGRDEAALKRAAAEFLSEIEYNTFVQWLFDKQWRILKKYAAGRGISIIGDMPF